MMQSKCLQFLTGKVICPDENESSNSHTTDSQTEDNLEPDSKSCDTQDELTYGNQIVCEEIEVLTSEDIQMSEDGTSGSFHMSNNGTQQQVFEIDEKFKQVSMSSESSLFSSQAIYNSCVFNAPYLLF